MSLAAGIYRILNIHSQDFAALLDGNDGSPVCTIIRGLRDTEAAGDTWNITHLRRNTYKIQSVKFTSYASYDPGPISDEEIRGKSEAKPWVIKTIDGRDAYTISPSSNVDIFWAAVDDEDGTPIAFGSRRSDKHAHWNFVDFGAVSVNRGPRLSNNVTGKNEGGVAADGASTTVKTATGLGDLKMSQILATLAPLDMDTSDRPRCLPETRLDHIQIISEWVTSLSDDNVLWISGVAGAGKSTLVNTISDIYREARRLGAFIYFNGDEEAHSQPIQVVKTIAFQLAKFNRQLGTAIAAVIDGDSQILNGTLLAQFSGLIINPVGTLGSRGLAKDAPPAVVVIIDALDQCGTSQERKDLLGIFSQKTSLLPHYFRFIITSRSEVDIENAFISRSHVRKHDLDINSATNKADVDSFVRSRMSQLSSQMGLGWPGEGRLRMFSEQAAGLFIWASTACAFIEEYPTNEVLDQLLILSALTPLEKLNQLYTTTMAATGPWHRPEFKRDCQSFLGLIVVARKPLSCTALDTLLRPAHPSVLLTARFKSLLHWSETAPIRPLHVSFTDYLTDRQRCGRYAWFVDVLGEELALANRCLDLLSRELKENIMGLTVAPQWHSRQDTGQPLSEATSYACTSWISHTCAIIDNSAKDTLSEKVYHFIRIHLLHWIEAMSILRQSRSCFSLLTELLRWIPTTYLGLSVFVNEAARFYRLFANEIEEHPLLVYHSALPMTPTETVISRSFHSFSSYIRVVGVQPQWGPLLQTFHFSPNKYVEAITFSPGGRSLAAAGQNGIQIWDVISGAEILCISSPNKHQSVAFAQGGRTIASGDHEGRLHVWDAISGNRLHISNPPSTGASIRQIAVSPSSEDDLITSVYGSGQLLFNRSDGSFVPGLPLEHIHDVFRCAFSSDGQKLAIIHGDNGVRLWNLPQWTKDGLLDHSEGLSESREGQVGVHFANDGMRILSQASGSICIWDINTRNRLRRFIDRMETISAVSSAGHLFSVSLLSSMVFVRNLDDFGGQATNDLSGHTDWVHSLSVSTDGAILASGGLDGTVRLWSVSDAVQPRSVFAKTPSVRIAQAAISPEGSLFATWSTSNHRDKSTIIRLWVTETVLPSKTHSVIQGPVVTHLSGEMRFSADGERIALRPNRFDSEFQEMAWDVRTGQAIVLDGFLSEFDWESNVRGDWISHECWVQYKGAYVTKLPFKGRFECARDGAAIFQEDGTHRLYVLKLPSGSAEGRIEESQFL